MNSGIKGHTRWSIYVRTNNLRNLKESHLPPISSALEHIEADWQIMTEDENPDLFRLFNYQNFEVGTVEEAVVPTLRRAYNLADSWLIVGLGDLALNRLRHVSGKCDRPQNSHQAPALDSLAFQIELGHLSPPDTDRG